MGKGHSGMSIARSLILLAILFFYIYTVASNFQVQIYPFEDRAISLASFFRAYVINEYLDHVIITVATIVWLALSRAEVKLKTVILLAWAVIWLAGAILEVGGGAAISIKILLDVSAVTALPVIMSLLIYQRVAIRKDIDNDMDLLVNYSSLLG